MMKTIINILVCTGSMLCSSAINGQVVLSALEGTLLDYDGLIQPYSLFRCQRTDYQRNLTRGNLCTEGMQYVGQCADYPDQMPLEQTYDFVTHRNFGYWYDEVMWVRGCCTKSDGTNEIMNVERWYQLQNCVPIYD